MNKFIVAATLLSLGVFPAFAYSATSQDNPSGPYIGAGWGRFNLDIRNLSDVGTATSSVVHSDGDAWKAFAGWRFIPYLAIEAAYIDFGDANGRFNATGSNGNYRVAMSGFSPSVIGILPLGPVELSVKAGSYFYDVKVKANFDNSNPSVESSHTRNDLLYGAGLGVTIANRLHLRAEYETIELKNASNTDAYWLSAAWRF